MLSLSESGIVHINLNSDNKSSVIEGNLITGYTSYQTTDGNTHLAADLQLQLSPSYNVESISVNDILLQEDHLDLKTVIDEASINNNNQSSAYKVVSFTVSDIENMTHQLDGADNSNPLS